MLPSEVLERYGISYNKGHDVPRADGTNIEQHIYESPRAKAIVSHVTKGKKKASLVEVRIITWERSLFGKVKPNERIKPKYLKGEEVQDYILGWLGE